MFLQINDSMSLQEVEDRFNECFPFLKIAFYSKGHKKFQASDKKYLYEGNWRVGDIRKSHYSGALEIKSWHSTAKVEKELEAVFGLHAQIFRWDEKKGWVQTSQGDDFTLQQQSQFGI
jgi:hypothetical protein